MGSSEGFMQVPSPALLQKDPGFDRGQFHKQIAVMRGQVSLGLLLVSSLVSLWEVICSC